MPPLLFAEHKSQIEIIGGTANPLAPPALDIKEVFLKNLEKLGINVSLKIIKEGFHPKGNGKIILEINPCNKLKEFSFQEINIKEVSVVAVSSEDLKSREVCKRMIKGFKLNFPLGYKISSCESYVDTLSPGCYIHSNINNQLGMSILGEKSIAAEELGKKCALRLLEEINSKATFDFFTADQMLIYLALAGKGEFKVSHISEHMKTNIEVIEKFLDVKFEIEDNKIKIKNNFSGFGMAKNFKVPFKRDKKVREF